MKIAAIAFALLAFGSVSSVILRRPWTAILAHRTTDPAHWGHPLFRETNTVLTLLWAAIFGVTAAIAALPDAGHAFVAMTFVNTGLGAVSPWLGKRYADWRASAFDE